MLVTAVIACLHFIVCVPPVILTRSSSSSFSMFLPLTLLDHSRRYTAVAMPLLYNTRYSSKRRVTVMISVVWVLSFAISCPLLFGLNNTGIFVLCYLKKKIQNSCDYFSISTGCTTCSQQLHKIHVGEWICTQI